LNRVPSFCLHRPSTVEGALEVLGNHESAAILMGGTELLPLLKLGLASVEHLIDCRGLMSDLRREGDQLIVGAGVIHRRLETDPTVKELFPAICEMEHVLANVRVRNVGTLGGNLCFAEPRSDPATLLVALGATVGLRSSSGQREVAVEDFLVGPFSTALEPGEVMIDVRIPVARADEQTGFYRLAFGERPAANIAFKVGPSDIRIAIGAVGLKVARATEAERLLRDGGAAALPAAAEAATEEIATVTDVDGSADYKRHLVGVLVRRALEPALAGPG
jgi:aerobic carbon-monoxide dehydrogenase medium subunit